METSRRRISLWRVGIGFTSPTLLLSSPPTCQKFHSLVCWHKISAGQSSRLFLLFRLFPETHLLCCTREIYSNSKAAIGLPFFDCFCSSAKLCSQPPPNSNRPWTFSLSAVWFASCFWKGRRCCPCLNCSSIDPVNLSWMWSCWGILSSQKSGFSFLCWTLWCWHCGLGVVGSHDATGPW